MPVDNMMEVYHKPLRLLPSSSRRMTMDNEGDRGLMATMARTSAAARTRLRSTTMRTTTDVSTTTDIRGSRSRHVKCEMLARAEKSSTSTGH